MKRGWWTVLVSFLLSIPFVAAEDSILSLLLGSSDESLVVLRLLYGAVLIIFIFKSMKEQFDKQPGAAFMASAAITLIAEHATPDAWIIAIGGFLSIIAPIFIIWFIVGFFIKDKGDGQMPWKKIIFTFIAALILFIALASSGTFSSSVSTVPGIGGPASEFLGDASYFLFDGVGPWLIGIIIGLVLLGLLKAGHKYFGGGEGAGGAVPSWLPWLGAIAALALGLSLLSTGALAGVIPALGIAKWLLLVVAGAFVAYLLLAKNWGSEENPQRGLQTGFGQFFLALFLLALASYLFPQVLAFTTSLWFWIALAALLALILYIQSGDIEDENRRKARQMWLRIVLILLAILSAGLLYGPIGVIIAALAILLLFLFYDLGQGNKRVGVWAFLLFLLLLGAVLYTSGGIIVTLLNPIVLLLIGIAIILVLLFLSTSWENNERKKTWQRILQFLLILFLTGLVFFLYGPLVAGIFFVTLFILFLLFRKWGKKRGYEHIFKFFKDNPIVALVILILIFVILAFFYFTPIYNFFVAYWWVFVSLLVLYLLFRKWGDGENAKRGIHHVFLWMKRHPWVSLFLLALLFFGLFLYTGNFLVLALGALAFLLWLLIVTGGNRVDLETSGGKIAYGKRNKWNFRDIFGTLLIILANIITYILHPILGIIVTIITIIVFKTGLRPLPSFRGDNARVISHLEPGDPPDTFIFTVYRGRWFTKRNLEGVRLRLRADVGRLSNNIITTNDKGIATVEYTPPSSPAEGTLQVNAMLPQGRGMIQVENYELLIGEEEGLLPEPEVNFINNTTIQVGEDFELLVEIDELEDDGTGFLIASPHAGSNMNGSEVEIEFRRTSVDGVTTTSRGGSIRRSSVARLVVPNLQEGEWDFVISVKPPQGYARPNVQNGRIRVLRQRPGQELEMTLASDHTIERGSIIRITEGQDVDLIVEVGDNSSGSLQGVNGVSVQIYSADRAIGTIPLRTSGAGNNIPGRARTTITGLTTNADGSNRTYNFQIIMTDPTSGYSAPTYNPINGQIVVRTRSSVSAGEDLRIRIEQVRPRGGRP